MNCGAIPETLFESELFGYEPGAFTDGLNEGKIGLWETASSGTLFLDEVAELPTLCQTKILRALQENAVRRVGAPPSTSTAAQAPAARAAGLRRVRVGNVHLLH